MRTPLITFLVMTGAHIGATEPQRWPTPHEQHKIFQRALPTEIVSEEEESDGQSDLTNSEGIENFEFARRELTIAEARRKERRCNALVQGGLGLLLIGTGIAEFWSMQHTDKIQNQSDDTIIKSELFFGGTTVLFGILGGAYKFEAASHLENKPSLAKRCNALATGALVLSVQNATVASALLFPQASKWLLGAGGSFGVLGGLQFFRQIYKDYRTS